MSILPVIPKHETAAASNHPQGDITFINCTIIDKALLAFGRYQNPSSQFCCSSRRLIWLHLCSASFWMNNRLLEWSGWNGYREMLYSMAIMHCWPLVYGCRCSQIPTLPMVQFAEDTWDSNFLAGLAYALSEGCPLSGPFYLCTSGPHIGQICCRFSSGIMELMKNPTPSLDQLRNLMEMARVIGDDSPGDTKHSNISLLISLNYAMKLRSYNISNTYFYSLWGPFNFACTKLFTVVVVPFMVPFV